VIHRQTHRTRFECECGFTTDFIEMFAHHITNPKTRPSLEKVREMLNK